MKAVILAGGFGTRISEESHLKPKPMIEIGGMPILWHIMKEYSYYGVNEFVICAGYKQHVIKEWFADYFLHTSDITFDFTNGNEIIVHKQHAEPWKVTVVDTGLNTMTGGRVKRIHKYVENESFFLTYGDAVSNVNISNLLEFHKKHGKICTLTSVSIAQQKGVLDIDSDDNITAFREKEDTDVPGISRKIITVGSFDDIRSGKGPTDCCIVKPEILAPGHDIISLGTRDGTYVRKTGTSMATPIVSGAIALLLEKNPNMRPEAVKLALYNTCDRAGDSHKGSWGIINVDKLVGIL